MKFLIDDASIDKIKEIYNYYPVDGITTNPTILSKTGRSPYEVLKEIRAFIGPNAELHVQVISKSAEDMVREGRKIVETLGENTYIKVPAVEEGLKAMRILSGEGYHVTATVIYTPVQAYLAAKSGADYVAPYVNRIENIGADGINITKIIQNIFDSNGYKTQILAASIKNAMQVQELCEYGIGAVTIAPDVIGVLIKNACVANDIDVFTANFEKAYGKGETMLDC